MRMLINFTKMQGLGNDFMVIDAINQSISLSVMQIQKLSNRHFGVGFDQLLLVEKPEAHNNDFKYRIFNADGSEVGQCGNGARCFARFVVEKKLTNKRFDEEIVVETKESVMTLLVRNNNEVVVAMGKPIWHSKDIPFGQLDSVNATYIVEGETLGVVSMGNPHAVLIVDDISQDIETIAKKIQNSVDFPAGVNVNFVSIMDRHNITLRVYERGVGETLACGSGACATVAYLQKINNIDANEVTVELKGGELFIDIDNNGVNMRGSAEFVFEGQVDI
ncbi:Diaminopimelate epimerase [Bathymodiolus thermophilus thioautotrophic gill symbiont]|uniref:diaminopimelate epimerase n=1 Tax=Bathymodiolus thermophilus thioautotrophic gill symbiont TaxID=2360 RepID=UPI0010AF9930|nr:diaminopimelate epimerase [Bathymodiolus thermophilus thioautotrophic gill symbiont]SGZ84996.1 Diaminopimelate epimerase [Bathymodiolus thermophilus thioautotrophic gill symbiont]